MMLRYEFLTLERNREASVAAWLAQKRKHVDDTFAQHVIAAETRDSLHRSIPRDELAVAIEREHAVGAGVDESGKHECGVDFMQICIYLLRYPCKSWRYLPAVRSINPVASRTSIFDPSKTGIANVDACATS